MYNKKIFQNPELWRNYDPSELLAKRVNLVLDFMPEDVRTILDVGCGNGILSNAFPERYQITGIDYSLEALRFVLGKKIQGSSDQMPVKNQSFDMIFSSELLEHLPTELLHRTIREFQRIAKRYIFITIPNNEILERNSIKCPKCDHIFHSYGHLHSFKDEDIIKMVGADFELLLNKTLGPSVREYNKVLLHIRHNLGKRWFPATKYTVCPNCGNSVFTNLSGNLISKTCNALNIVFSRQKPYWLFMLFRRKGLV
ncbi:MAG: class I SAM-dependent methyltransferase [Calditrichia bacterium]